MKSKNWIGLMMVGILITIMAACSPPAPEETVTPTATSAPTRPSATPAPTDSPIATPTAPTSPLATPVAQSAAVTATLPGASVRALITHVAKAEKLEQGGLEIISVEEKTWSDTSLGCPQPGMAYAQVMVEGWLVHLRDAEGRYYEVHTDEDMDTIVICDTDSSSQKPAPHLTPQSNPALEAAIDWLVENHEVTRSTIQVKEVQEVEWSDSCLGCTSPKEACLMVITPGYRIILQSGSQTYELHTDEAGRSIRQCTSSERAPAEDK